MSAIVKVQVCMPPDLLHEAREEAKNRGASWSGLVRTAIERELNRAKRERHLAKVAAEYARERELDGLEAVM